MPAARPPDLVPVRSRYCVFSRSESGVHRHSTPLLHVYARSILHSLHHISPIQLHMANAIHQPATNTAHITRTQHLPSNFSINDVLHARLILFNYKTRSTVIKPKTSPGSLVVMTWSIQSGIRNIAGGRRGWRRPVSGVLESTVRWATKTLVRFQPRAFFLFVSFWCLLLVNWVGREVCM